MHIIGACIIDVVASVSVKSGTTEVIHWSVNREVIATIGENNGKLEGKKGGKVKVTATCGSLKKSVTIKVKK